MIPIPISAYGFLFFTAIAITQPAIAVQPRLGSTELVNPAPTSSMSKAEAKGIAQLWAMASPGRAYCEVSSTSSMVPVFDSKSILLLEPVSAGELHRNDIARYEHARLGNVTHRVIEVDSKGATFEGDNCAREDVRVSANQIRYRVAGILYTRGT